MPKPQGQRVFQCERWVEFSETWPTSGTMRNGRLSPLEPSEPRTSASESSSSPALPTPSARDWKGHNPNRGGGLDLPGAIKLLPTPEAKSSTAGPDYARATRPGSGGDDLVTTVCKVTRGDLDWGQYQPAIDRWEGLTRPAPYPTEPNTKGEPRLAAAFSEWMMGWPEGWVTDLVTDDRRDTEGISRTAALKMIGNGVCTQQAAAAIRDLLD
ncbi:DNA methylase [Mycobacterium phage Goose]|uniref:DNA methylase n=1 Tax=Mycobacterium phage Goose TaxID=2927989 RepID=K0G8P2_9CAUD|nr:DNA methyltransferase [Mycobacterium phage Goose]AFU20713.1 DNA methylase [Mycobacterium phage Goose]